MVKLVRSEEAPQSLIDLFSYNPPVGSDEPASSGHKRRGGLLEFSRCWLSQESAREALTEKAHQSCSFWPYWFGLIGLESPLQCSLLP